MSLSVSPSIRVLIVEDRPEDAELMVHELKRAGFDPDWRRVETEADYLAQLGESPDVVLTDHNLPRFGAPRALELLREHGSDIPCIVVTGSVSEEAAVERMKEGAADYILKDRMGRLGQAVIRALEQKRAKDERRGAEEALRQSEERFRELAENIREVFFITGPSGSPFLYVTPFYEEIWGQSRKGLYADARAWIESIHPEDRSRVKQAFRTSPGSLDHEYRIVRPDGSIKWIHSRSFKVRDEKGAVLRVVGIAEDITKRKRAEEEVRQNLERIRALHEIDLAITSRLDFQNILGVLLEKINVFFPYDTASTVRLFERGSDRLAHTASRNLDEADWKSRTILSAAGRSKEIFENRRPVVIRNLQTDPRTSHRPFYSGNGLVSYLGVPLMTKDAVLGILSLYTKQEHDFSKEEIDFLVTLAGQVAVAIHNARLLIEARERAKEQEALAAIAQATSQSLSLDEVLQVAMDEVLRLTGRKKGYIRLKDPVTGQINLAVERGISEEYVDVLLHQRTPGGKTDQVFDTGEPLIVNDPTQTVLKEATRREGAACVAWIPIKAGRRTIGVLNIQASTPPPFQEQEIEVLKAIGHIIGIAVENSRLFEGMKEHAEILARANRVKDDFLSVMSHELRTPLNVVMGYTAMMRDGLLGAINRQQAEALQKVMDRANEQLEMINNVLYATVLEVQKPGVEKEKLSPSDFLDELRSEYDARLFPEGLTLRWDYPGDLPLLRTDGGKLRVVLQNLIGNAIKFTSRGEVAVSAEVSGDGRSGGWLKFQVADTGVGILPEHLPFIFEKFRQADSSQTRSYGGVGMGLYIVKRFAELLGGTVNVESEPEKGSTFTVALPLSLV